MSMTVVLHLRYKSGELSPDLNTERNNSSYVTFTVTRSDSGLEFSETYEGEKEPLCVEGVLVQVQSNILRLLFTQWTSVSFVGL